MGYFLDDWKCCCTLLIVMSGKQRHVIIPPETGSDTQCRSFIIKNLLFHVKIVISTKRGFRFVAVDNYRTEFNRGFLAHAHVRLLLQQLFNYKPLLKSCRIPWINIPKPRRIYIDHSVFKYLEEYLVKLWNGVYIDYPIFKYPGQKIWSRPTSAMFTVVNTWM